jgi:hypothetical protein
MQELKNSPTGQCGKNTGPAICKLWELVNQISVERYELVVSDRVGTGSGIEQYVLFYKPSVARLLRYEVFNDTTKSFARPPALAYLQIGTETFWVVNIHTNPDNAIKEITNLPSVVSFVNKTDTDILLLGDFNADSPYFPERTNWPKVFPLLSGHWRNLIWDNVSTTVSGSLKSYDRFLISPSLFPFFLPSTASPFLFNQPASGGFSMGAILANGCALGYLPCGAPPLEAALKVSDHYPIRVNAFEGLGVNNNNINNNAAILREENVLLGSSGEKIQMNILGWMISVFFAFVLLK